MLMMIMVMMMMMTTMMRSRRRKGGVGEGNQSTHLQANAADVNERVEEHAPPVLVLLAYLPDSPVYEHTESSCSSWAAFGSSGRPKILSTPKKGL